MGTEKGLLKEIVKKIIQDEVRVILAESRENIKEIVAATLIPGLKAAVRKEINQNLEIIFEQSVEKTESDTPKSAPSFNSSEIVNPRSPMALYLYAIADGAETADLGPMGLDGNRVYTLPFGDFSAVVHDCKADPYQSDDRNKVEEWLLTHQNVVDATLEKFGTVIPMGFDTIISGKGNVDPEENMRKWIETDRQDLTEKMAKIRNKAEYGIQIFWETHVMARNVSEKSTEIKALEREIRTKPKGIAYMYRQKLEELLKNEMARKADRYFQEFYEKIKVHTDDLRVEKTKKADDEGVQMLLNLSCLLSKGQSEILGQVLQEIGNREGFSVRYTGPWPPYSFV